jgi:hypothetical protein
LRRGRTFTSSPGTFKCRAVIMQNRGPVYQGPHTFNLSLPRSLTAPHTNFAGRRQNRVQERPADAAGEAGGSAGDNLGAAFGGPIAFFTASQITSRENGFSRKSAMESFFALNATAAGSYPEIRIIGVAPHFDRMRSATSSPEPSANWIAICMEKATNFRNISSLGREGYCVLLLNRSRPCENSIATE